MLTHPHYVEVCISAACRRMCGSSSPASRRSSCSHGRGRGDWRKCISCNLLHAFTQTYVCERITRFAEDPTFVRQLGPCRRQRKDVQKKISTSVTSSTLFLLTGVCAGAYHSLCGGAHLHAAAGRAAGSGAARRGGHLPSAGGIHRRRAGQRPLPAAGVPPRLPVSGPVSPGLAQVGESCWL